MKGHSLLNKITLLLTVIATASTSIFTSCEDGTNSLGSSLVEDKSEVIADSTFTITARSINNPVIENRTLTQLIGSIQVAEFGSLSADYVTQFMPSAELDTTGVTINDIDSIKLILRFYGSKITGDSLMPMGIKVYPLIKNLPDTITSAFNPSIGGYYDPSVCWGSSIYTSNTVYDDSIGVYDIHAISIKLPLELGKSIYTKYLESPETFFYPERFADFIPGVYIANSFGAGRVTNIFNTRLALYYRSNQKYTNLLDQERDTTYYRSIIVGASSPEVITNNCLRYSIDAKLTDMAKKGDALVIAPLGLETEIRFPFDKLVETYNKNNTGSMAVVNSLSFFLPAEEITNQLGIDPPAQLLMVRKSERATYFNEEIVPDNSRAFIAYYSSSRGGYVVSDMRPCLMNLINAGTPPTDDDCEYILTPIGIETETYTNSSYQTVEVITAIAPFIEAPAMVKLLPAEAKIKLTISKETINF